MKFYLQPELWSKELNAGNLESLLHCYAEDATLFSTFQAQPIKTPEGIRDYFSGFLAREGAGVCLNSTSIAYQTFSENLYISTGLYEFFYRENGEEIRHPARFTYVVKEETAHKIKHHHSSLVPA